MSDDLIACVDVPARQEDGTAEVPLSPMVFIHGDFSNGMGTWSKQMDRHPNLRRVVVDRRGHGDSPSGTGPWTIQGDAEDVLALLRNKDIDKAHIVGHSYGGLIAVELAALAPSVVATLHLVEPSYLALLPDEPVVTEFDASVRRLIDSDTTMSADAFTAAFFTLLMGDEATAKIRTRPVWDTLVRESHRYVLQQYAGDFDPARLRTLVQTRRDGQNAVPYPVVVYTGGRSHPALQRVAQRIAHIVDDARLVTVEDAGHSVQHAGSHFDDVLREYVASPGHG